jgi:hypothetical protein|tara:strand:+ start:312 stop:548 length:237 start_codon:yes stop_codon:yes gene_type:complete
MAKKQVIQKHHISYPNDPDGEITVNLYKGEHWAITVLNRRKKNMSKGFLRCLQKYINEHKEDAVDLDEAFDLDEEPDD